MRFDVITLFPEMVHSAARFGVTGKAINDGVVELNLWNPRDYTEDKHRTVDDRPYGGGPGMVMKCQPLADAVESARQIDVASSCVICLSPQGQSLKQSMLQRISRYDQVRVFFE